MTAVDRRPRVRRGPLDRLLDPGAVDRLLRSVETTLPRVRLHLEDAGDDDRAPTTPGTARVVRAGGRPVAILRADGPVSAAALDHVVLGLELAVDEATARRALAAEVLEAYRELSLLHRVAGTIGSTLDVRAIGPAILAEAERVLRADAGIVVPVPADPASPVVPARRGPGDAVERLAMEAQHLVARIAASGHPGIEVRDDARGSAFGSLLGAPIRDGERVLGAVVLGRRHDREAFTAGDQKLVLALAQHAAIALERAGLHELDAERRRLEHEMALGRHIQLALLPQVLPQPAGWRLAAAYRAARDVGGDFYDVFPLRRRRPTLGIVVADVTGKGIPAALVMAFSRAMLRAAADHSRGPAEALERANRVLVHERRTSLFITVFHATLELSTGELRYASAGHEAPLLVPAGGRLRRLPGDGMLLGAIPALGLDEQRIVMAPGDLLVTYTDGVTDARRATGERFGDDRLTRAVRSAAGELDGDAAGAVLAAVDRFRGPAPAADDLTLLTVRRRPATRPGSRRGGAGR